MIVEWGKNTKSGITQEGRNLTIGLGSRKKLNPTELKKSKDFRSGKAILVSKQDGGNGPDRLIYYASEWTVSFEKKRIYYKDGKFNAGKRMDEMLPNEVPVSHFAILGQLGREMFDKPRFHGVRMFGDVDIENDEIYIARFMREDGKEFRKVFADPADARTMVAFSVALEKEPNLKLHDVTLIKPRTARKEYYRGMSGPTAVVELARKNSLSQKNRIKELEEDLKRGEDASRILTRIREGI